MEFDKQIAGVWALVDQEGPLCSITNHGHARYADWLSKILEVESKCEGLLEGGRTSWVIAKN